MSAVDSRDDAWLWAGVLAGPIAWGVDLVVSYVVVEGRVAARPGVLLAISAVAFVVSVGGAAIGARMRRRVAGERPRFMAHMGIAMSLFFALVIVAMAVPRLVLLPSEAL